MNKKKIIFQLIGLISILFPFFINIFNYYRLFSFLFGIFILSFCSFKKQRNYIKTIMFILSVLFLGYVADTSSAFFLKRIPIFSYKNIMNSNFYIYESLFYRIYTCENDQIFDEFYQKNYVCNFPLDTKEINVFLNNLESNYKKYHHKFITIKGKISEVYGNEYILLQSYEQKENSLVGQLTFNNGSSVKILNNQRNLKFYGNYEIYDTVLVTGRIVEKKDKEIVLHDPKIEIIQNFDNFKINIIEQKNCKKKLKELTKVGDIHFYSNCIDEVFVGYDEETIYDLILALETKKLTFEKWSAFADKEENEEKELYKFDNYHLLKCKTSNTIILGNNKLKLNSKLCEDFST